MDSASIEPVSATYHVFINNRGPDVKNGLASLIYHRLKSCGFRVFLDKNEIHTGDELSPAIMEAINSASVHIAIFSKRYAESKWVLDQLCWILRCNRMIIPVFYDVEPIDLRYSDRENGRYREAFEDHQREKKVAIGRINKWKTALNKASDISGPLFKTDESDLGEVLEEIVKAVFKGVERKPYHVFLNHRGPDVKKSLASLIYHRLKSCGLRVFLDKNEIHTGDELSPAIMEAIKSASVHIAIFSKRYAESKWCLFELCSILRCERNFLLPVFYDIEPADLRYTDRENGRYREAFEEHQRKNRVAMGEINKWKKALNRASNISGLMCNTDYSDLGEVLEEIVKIVLKVVETEPFELLKYPANFNVDQLTST